MRSLSLHILCVVASIAIVCAESNEHETSLETAKSDVGDQESSFIRKDRELENFNYEYPKLPSKDLKEEPSFWDKIVTAALKLFSRFVEWLNSS